MTKSRKPAAITFPTTKVNGVTIRRNAETGIEIHPQGRDGYVVYFRTMDGTLSYWGDERTLAGARALATERVEMIREQVAQAYDEAVIEIYDGLQTVEGMVAARADEFPALAETYRAAWHSFDNGFIPAANERLYRVLDHLTGRKLFPSKAESEAALAAAAERLPEHIRVELTFGERHGMRAMIVGKPFIFAEFGTVCIAVKLSRNGQYRTEHADTVRELVGRDRP
jgi:hypothetical protein